MKQSYINKKPQHHLDFSFSQENNSHEIYAQDNYLIGSKCRTKYEFLKSLIEKYDQKPKRIPEENNQTECKLREESSSKKVRSTEKPLAPKPNRQEKQNKDEQLEGGSNSDIKSKLKEVEKSHQELLDKFKSPLQNNCKPNQRISEKQMKSENISHREKREDEYGQKDKSAISTQNSSSSGSIPLIESVLMSNQQSGRSLVQPEMKESPVRELSEFQIPEGEISVKREKKEEPKVYERQKQNENEQNVEVKQDENQRMTIFWVSFIIVLIILLFYPTDQFQGMNDF